MSDESTNWRDVLKAQQEDLKALQTKQSNVDDDELDADIERVLRRPAVPSWIGKGKSSSSSNNNNKNRDNRSGHNEMDDLYAENDNYDEDSEAFMNIGGGDRNNMNYDTYNGDLPPARDMDDDVDISSTPPRRPGSGVATIISSDNSKNNKNRNTAAVGNDNQDTINAEDSVATPKVPDAGARFQKAKVKMLTKQLDDMTESKKRLSEQVDSLNHQLKNDREENKLLRKR